MKGNPAVPGGLLTSKPMWMNTVRCSATSASLFAVIRDGRGAALMTMKRRTQFAGTKPKLDK